MDDPAGERRLCRRCRQTRVSEPWQTASDRTSICSWSLHVVGLRLGYARERQETKGVGLRKSVRKQLDISRLLSSIRTSSHNSRLNCRHVVEITTGEGICLFFFCSWHFLLLTYAGLCFAAISLSEWIMDGRNNNCAVKRQMQADCNFCPSLFVEQIQRCFTVLSQLWHLKEKYCITLLAWSKL